MLVEAGAEAAAAGEASAASTTSVGEALVTGEMVARGGVLAVAVDAAVVRVPCRVPLLRDEGRGPS